MSVTTDATLNPIVTDLVNLIGNNEFVGTRVLPVKNSNKKKGIYPVFGATEFDNNASKSIAPGAKYPRRDTRTGSDDFYCKKHGLEHPIPDEDVVDAEEGGISDIKGSISSLTARDLMIGHELRVANLVYSAGFNATSATQPMSDKAAATPIEDIQKAVRRLSGNGFNRNLSLIIEDSLYDEMINTDDVRSIFNGAAVYTNRQVLLDAFGVQEIIICPTRYNSAAKGKAAVRTKVWPVDQYVVGQVVGGEFAEGGFGRTIAYQRLGGLFTAEEYRDTEGDSDIIRVKNFVDEVIINTNAGEKITGA